MTKVAIISAYFGRLPSYYHMWMRSCEKNSTIDFFLVTDQKNIDYIPDNVNIINMSFSQLHELINEKLGLEVCLASPYKLCDYKTMYGAIFEDYIKDYDYWAHCDIDMIFGNLRKFFEEYSLESYEKFLHFGHLSLYRNTDEVRSHFMSDGGKYGSWKYVVSTEQNCFFDEWDGIYDIYKTNGFSMFDKTIFADISIIYHRFRLALEEKNYDRQVFYWDNGGVFRSFMVDGKMQKDEFIYIHFKHRKMERIIEEPEKADSFFITYDGFYEKEAGIVDNEDIDKYNKFSSTFKEKYELIAYDVRRNFERVSGRINRLRS